MGAQTDQLQFFSAGTPRMDDAPAAQIKARCVEVLPQQEIFFAFAKTRFGESLLAATQERICFLAFTEVSEYALQTLQRQFPQAKFTEAPLSAQQTLGLSLVNGKPIHPEETLQLALQGTAFQEAVWRHLLQLRPGETVTYLELAKRLGNPRAAQAVGNAVGANKIAWLIPCHRVVRSDGALGGYAWGIERKAAMLAAEKRLL